MNRKYIGTYTPLVTVINAKPGTWRREMLRTILRYADTDKAQKALRRSKFKDRRLDFGFAEREGYIKF